MSTMVGPDGYVEAEAVAAEAHGTYAVARFEPDPDPEVEAQIVELAAFIGIRIGASTPRARRLAEMVVADGWTRPSQDAAGDAGNRPWPCGGRIVCPDPDCQNCKPTSGDAGSGT